MKNLLIYPIALSVAVLAGCGSGSDDPQMAAAMSAVGTVVPPGPDTEAGNTDNTVNSTEPPTDTNTLVVDDSFAFDTARAIDIDFDLEAARHAETSVSICTNYSEDNSGYDIDFDSCTVQGTMQNGVFRHSMEVTNEFTSVVAVVWFLDQSAEPVYREFSVDVANSSDRNVKSVNGKAVIVWR